MSLLVLLRHGQSEWNLENRFTGWQDVDLSPLGIAEAQEAGRQLANIHFDKVFCSPLKRAVRTAEYVLSANQHTNTYDKDCQDALKERDYGDLTGLNKADTITKYGKDQVQIWRRSYDVPPPGGESLLDVVNRVNPYYQQNILPLLQQGKNILFVAHGNTIRALLVAAGVHSAEGIMQVEIPTGIPLFFEWHYNHFHQINEEESQEQASFR